MTTSQLDRIEAKLDRLQTALDQAAPLLEVIPGVIATAGNTLDDLARRDGADHLDQRLRRAVAVLLQLSEPELLAAIEGLLQQRAGLIRLAELAGELPHAVDAPAERHGILGLLGVLREDEVQRALSVVIHFARRVGRVLDDADRQPAPALPAE